MQLCWLLDFGAIHVLNESRRNLLFMPQNDNYLIEDWMYVEKIFCFCLICFVFSFQGGNFVTKRTASSWLHDEDMRSALCGKLLLATLLSAQ